MSTARSIMVGAVLVLVSTASSGCAGEVTPAIDPAAANASTPPSSPSAQRVSPARRAPSALGAQAPRTVTLPSGRTVAISAVGTTAAGLLDVPADVDVAGWWRGGARLGDPFGSILLAAHVDSRTEGLGPFAELLTAGRGTRVSLTSSGLAQTFVIRSRRLLPQGSLAGDSWIFAPSGTSRLTLVTCAPPYDVAHGGYQKLAVVTAVPLAPAVRS